MICEIHVSATKKSPVRMSRGFSFFQSEVRLHRYLIDVVTSAVKK